MHRLRVVGPQSWQVRCLVLTGWVLGGLLGSDARSGASNSRVRWTSMVTELEEDPMTIVGGLDIHRKQLTFDYVEVETGRLERGRITPADRAHLAGWLARFDGQAPVAFAMEGGTGWRYVAEEMRNAGVEAPLAEPADTSALRGPKRRAKTDKADAQLLRELLAAGRVPECYIPPSAVLEWRGPLGVDHPPRRAHTRWGARPHPPTLPHRATPPPAAGAGRRCPAPPRRPRR